MPILFALYRVFYNVPAYIGSVKNIFTELVNGIVATDGFATTMQTIYDDAGIRLQQTPDFTSADPDAVSNFIVDVLYKLPASGWAEVADKFPSFCCKA